LFIEIVECNSCLKIYYRLRLFDILIPAFGYAGSDVDEGTRRKKGRH